MVAAEGSRRTWSSCYSGRDDRCNRLKVAERRDLRPCDERRRTSHRVYPRHREGTSRLPRGTRVSAKGRLAEPAGCSPADRHKPAVFRRAPRPLPPATRNRHPHPSETPARTNERPVASSFVTPATKAAAPAWRTARAAASRPDPCRRRTSSLARDPVGFESSSVR